MLKPNKSRVPERPNFKGEATPGQLVVVVCILLFLALLCFSLGVFVGRFERNQGAVRVAERTENQETPLPPSPRGATEPVQEEASAPQGGVQTSPRRVPMPSPAASTAPGYPNSSEQPIAVQPTSTGPRYSELPAPPPRSQQEDAQEPAKPETQAKPVQKPSEPSESAQGSERSGAATQSPAGKNDVGTAENADVKPAPEAGQSDSVTKNPPVAAETGATANLPAKTEIAADSTKASSAESTKGGYCIQVASFSGSNRKRLAEEYRRRMKSNAELTVDLIPSDDDKYIRVVMGNYPDRDTAARACAELKKRQGFAESFVRKR